MARCAACHRRLLPGQSCLVHGGPAAPPSRAPGDKPAWSRPLDFCIGSGGFASVWEIHDGGVLKVAHVAHDLARARMAREAEALAAIGRPTVPAVFEHGVLPDGRAWIAMERVDGDNLGDMTTTGPIRSDRAIAIALAILESLGRVHAAGFVHRDLKPDNLVVRGDRSIAILDLGLARKLPVDEDDPTRANVQVGSLEYIPPEQLLDASVADARADLYAFGCIAYELCAGRPPFLGDAAALERAHAALRPPPLGALAAVPTELEEIVHACLAKLPARRPASVAALRERFAALRDTTPPSLRTQRADHAWSVIGEGTQPVVLLWAELPRVDRKLLASIAAHDVAVVSQRGRRVLAAATGASHPDPAGIAIAAARDLVAAGARVALHLEELRVAQEAGGIAVTGAAAEQPERWLPAIPWNGAVMTRALATVTRVPARPSALGPGFVALGDPGEVPELFGRDGLLADLAADAAAALAGLGPGLALLVGDAGMGKTAIAQTLGPRLYEMGARVVSAAVPRPGAGRDATVLAELLGDATTVRGIGDALRAAARAGPTAILLDDVHFAEPALLDAIEYATLGGEALPLWILASASPRLEVRRTAFGARAERFRRDVIAPLDEDSAVDLIAAALRPAEYPPLRALRQIAEIARGNPLHLTALTREIHDLGAVRPRANGEHFLDTTALAKLPPLALGPWLAARELADIGNELVALARVCAVLGDGFHRDELAAVVALAERRGGASSSIDVDVGLQELAATNILERLGERWVFRRPLVHDGIYATTDAGPRAELHATALAHWQTRPGDALAAERLARHAEAVDDHAVAAAAFATLGARAHAEHRAVDADRAWQGALRHLPVRDAARARALLGRARARYRIQRIRDALADLDEAIAIAVEVGDVALEVEVQLERATALDWSQDLARAKDAVARAAERLATIPAPATLTTALELGGARALFRDGKLDEAVPMLRAVSVTGTPEQATIAAMLLAPCLVQTGDLDAAEREFERVIASCIASGDRFHLAGAYLNRVWLWSARGVIERVADDLQLVIDLARESGAAWFERAATHNLAEELLWTSSLDDALRLARRSLALATSMGETDTDLDRLLVCRIHAARGERAALAALAPEIAVAELADDDRAVFAALTALLDGGEPAWEAALAGSASLPLSYRLEIARLAAAADRLSAERRDEVAALIQTSRREAP